MGEEFVELEKVKAAQVSGSKQTSEFWPIKHKFTDGDRFDQFKEKKSRKVAFLMLPSRATHAATNTIPYTTTPTSSKETHNF